ncbi:MAG: MarR family EPS-associated transcriptional regulator [Syntrophales bacterium]
MSVQPPGRRENETMLRIFREIDRSPATTQRTLSSRLGISLGRVNFLINTLIAKGFVQVENFRKASANGPYLYRLTPQGLEEKTRATQLSLEEKIREQQRLTTEIRQLKREVRGSASPLRVRDDGRG